MEKRNMSKMRALPLQLTASIALGSKHNPPKQVYGMSSMIPTKIRLWDGIGLQLLG